MLAPNFESIPLDVYRDVVVCEEEREPEFYVPEFEHDVPVPEPRKRRERKPFTSSSHDEVRPFLDLPESLRDTVIGKLSAVVAEKLEFPEVSTFTALLGSASVAVSCSYATQYTSKTPVALGLYIVIEQPPATQKSRLLGIGIDPYAMAMGEHNKKVYSKNRENRERDLPADVNLKPGFAVTTDATSASLDGGLARCSEGRFVIASAEQSALTSLFPESGSYSSNNELILKGYAGEYVNGMRAGREAFAGVVQGAIVLIAQPGSCRRVISASNGTGMAERFFFLSEPTMLGGRDLKGGFPSHAETRAFEEACDRCVQLYSDRVMAQAPLNFGDRETLDPAKLEMVKPTASGYAMILNWRRDHEYDLGLLSERGEMITLSWLGKFETHVIKVAAVLHVIECLGNGTYPGELIPDRMVSAAMDYVEMISSHLSEILHDAGESGVESEEDCIIDVLSGRPLSKREVVLKAKNRRPYRAMGRSAYSAAGKRIDAMVESGSLIVNARGKLEVV